MNEQLRKFVDAQKFRGRRVSEAVPSEGDVYVWRGGDNEWQPEPNGGGAGTGEANTASNVGSGGVGLFKQKTGVNFEFKNINAGSAKITITNDTGNDEVDIDVNESAIDHDALNNVALTKHRIWTIELLTGTINGVNKTFTISTTPTDAEILLERNGQGLAEGASRDYTRAGTSITFAKAPKSFPGNPDVLKVAYRV